MVLVKHKQGDVKVRHNGMKFYYEFKKDIPLDIPKEHADFLIKTNEMFELAEDKKVKKGGG